MKDKSLKSKIKEMEAAKRELAQPTVSSVEAVSFDQWWMLLNKRMELRSHMKEIVWADFKARGCKKEELITRYDEALKLFGL